MTGHCISPACWEVFGRHRGKSLRKDGIGRDYMGNASFTVTPVSFSADLPVERMALLIDEDLKDVLSHDREERY